jgi:hypothetical protein
MGINYNDDRNIALGIARSFSAYETGNLRYNAIKSELVHNGFNIIYDLNEAFYIYFLEEGTRYTTKNVGFIGDKTVPTIKMFLQSKYNGDNPILVMGIESFARQGDIDISTIKGLEPELIARGKRLQQSLLQNVESLESLYSWQYKEYH